MSTPDNLAAYYARRAGEYERIYDKPERQREIALLKDMLAEKLAGQDVLEIACGTGYWTVGISAAASSILGVDVNQEVLDLAGRKSYPKGNVRFQIADAYTLAGVPSGLSAALAGFWWSHIPRGRRGEFLRALRGRLRPGAVIVLMDNLYVHGSNNPQSEQIDAEGNTYSLRRLSDGSQWSILKNFPTEEELRADLAGFRDVRYRAMRYYWWLNCTA